MTDRNTANLLSRIDLLMRANDQQVQTIDRLRRELAQAKRGK